MTAAVATVKGGFWAQYGVTLTSTQARQDRPVQQALGRRGMMALRALMASLNGVAPGGAAAKTLGRIQASSELGGKRTIETNTIINRVSAAADVTEIAAHIVAFSTKTTFGASPPANKDGNPLGTR